MVNGKIEIEVEELEDLIALAARDCIRQYEELSGDIVTFIASYISARINCHLTGEVPFSADELKVVREIRERFSRRNR